MRAGIARVGKGDAVAQVSRAGEDDAAVWPEGDDPAGYIRDMAGMLARIARQNEYALLGYFLEMAALEAQNELNSKVHQESPGD